jgi:membrane-bound lytic murein transglycosylase B
MAVFPSLRISTNNLALISRLALLCLLVGSPVRAQQMEFEQWLDALRDEAVGEGISAATLEAALLDIQPIERVIELDRKQPEFTETFWTYLDKRVTPWRIERGRELLKTHRSLLQEVSSKYGVPPRYLVAFWGLETNFGSYLGAFPVVGALATLAYDERRSDFFRVQLLDALKILDHGDITPARMKGSWAGAMGHLQFIPTTFTRYAVDATGDGKRDIWNTLPDVFASGANYLSQVGWKEDEIWGREVRLPKNFDWQLAGLTHKKPLSEWSQLGVRRANGAALPKADMRGAIVLPQGYRGPAFLVYGNFEVILTWNRSINYAIAVGHLADRLIGLPPFSNGREVDNRPLTRNQAMAIQRLLNRFGYDAGKVDGVPGARTKAAVRDYQSSVGLPVDGYPSVSLLEHLQRNDRQESS